MLATRRGFLGGLFALATPAICKAESLMDIRGILMELPVSDYVRPEWCPEGWVPAVGQTVSKYQFPELHAQFAACKQWGADKSCNFHIPQIVCAVPTFDAYEDTLQRTNTQPRKVVPLLSTKALRRSNGTIAIPGMSTDYALPATTAL